jgi:hypothetical protein
MKTEKNKAVHPGWFVTRKHRVALVKYYRPAFSKAMNTSQHSGRKADSSALRPFF